MKLGIIGSRGVTRFNIAPLVHSIPKAVVSGGAKGVDTLAANYAKQICAELVEIRPDFAKYGRGATFVRNREIVERSDKMLIIWDGKSHGTKYTFDYARKLNKPILLVVVNANNYEDVVSIQQF